MGFTDLLSRLPSGKIIPTFHYDEAFVMITTNHISENEFEKINKKNENGKKNQLVI